MSRTYRVDHASADDSPVVIGCGTDRAKAMNLARRLSRQHTTAYAIATANGADTGQRVYHLGYFSHADDDF